MPHAPRHWVVMRFDAEVRTRILTSSVVAVVVAVLLFGVPLAFAVGRLFADEERSELERVALRAAAELSPDDVVAGHPLRLAHLDPSVRVAVYRPDGTKVVGRGPTTSDQAVRALRRKIQTEPFYRDEFLLFRIVRAKNGTERTRADLVENAKWTEGVRRCSTGSVRVQ